MFLQSQTGKLVPFVISPCCAIASVLLVEILKTGWQATSHVQCRHIFGAQDENRTQRSSGKVNPTAQENLTDKRTQSHVQCRHIWCSELNLNFLFGASSGKVNLTAI